jgi:hypothetical protein
MIIFEDFEAREGATSVTLLECFKSAFNNFDDKWVPTDREQKIFQAASESHYNENSIERIFFQFGGGWTGIIGLVLAFRTSDKQHWQKLGLSEAKELAREVSRLPCAQVKKLMDDVGRQRSAYSMCGEGSLLMQEQNHVLRNHLHISTKLSKRNPKGRERILMFNGTIDTSKIHRSMKCS